MITLPPEFRSRAGLAGLAAILLLLPAIWLFAPLLGIGGVFPLEFAWARWLLCLALLLGYLGLLWWRGWRGRGRDQALVEAVTGDFTQEALAEEAVELRQKLTAALASLRRIAARRGAYLYELPWYLLIGPPGAGKTTAIARSGLEFPLAEGKLPGFGGTRNCDWWLSGEAVLLDTAGRYTTQDSDSAVDAAGWGQFLAMLRRARPRQPLNGIIVAFGIDLIAGLDAAGREAHARTLRRRVRELETALSQRLPIYFLVTKADLLPGFVEFFEDLNREARGQVWGVTLPLAPAGQPATGFGPSFAALLQRLQDRLPERLMQERGAAQRAAMAGFPAQVAALQAPLASFIGQLFGGSRVDPAPLLRGIYLTSGTQEGVPLDRLAGAMTRSFGLVLPAHRAGAMPQGRSYFLARLLREVVFNEARLAARGGDRRRRRVLALAVWGGAVLVLAGGLAASWSSYARERGRAAAMQAAIADATTAGQALQFDPVTDGDVLPLLPYLDATRRLQQAAGEPGFLGGTSGLGGLGLGQGEKLAAGAGTAYRHALDRVLLPRLLAGIEAQMRASLQQPDRLYEAARVYLMLGRQGPLDAALVRGWMAAEWAQTYPGAVQQPQRDRLLSHLDTLLAQDFASYPLDGALVDTARRIFSRVPMAVRVYSRLRATPGDLPRWNPADALGQAGKGFFTRGSGRPLTEGVPGFFTLQGLYGLLLPGLPQAARAAAAESWVLGPAAAEQSADDPAKLEQAVLELYAKDYGDAWQGLLDDLVLPPFGGLRQAAEGLNLLGAPNSPLRDLLRGIARQLSPGTPPGAETRAPDAAKPAGDVTADPGRAAAAPAARLIEARFADLRAAAGAPLDEVLRLVNELYAQVAALAAAPPGTAPAPVTGLDPGQRLLSEAARQPEPLSRWLRALAQSTQQARSGGVKASIAAAAGQQLAPLCRGIEGFFPFRRSGPDMPLGDFQRLFSPGGAIDQFFAQYVQPYADTTQDPWRPVVAGGMAPPLGRADIQQFQRARAIRDAFFPGGAGAELRFELLPQALDPGATGGVLQAEGAGTDLGPAAPARPILLAWPSRGGSQVNLLPNTAPPLAFDGAWSSLRLVLGPQALLQPTAQGRERLQLSLQQGERSARFELRAGSRINPFLLPELESFRCPILAP
jgi:type VI secretion system protein ImpL